MNEKQKDELNKLISNMIDAAVELAEYASYAEITGNINCNQQPIRKSCDIIFQLNRQIDNLRFNGEETK